MNFPVKNKLIILRNESDTDHLPWVKACEKFADVVDYQVIDITKAGWFEQVTNVPFDYLLAKPSGKTSRFKQLYDERIRILVDVMKYPVFPTMNEILIYENKRYISFWLEANKINHPRTFVFYNKNEDLQFIKSAKFPLVAKLNIGASGNGITILKSEPESIDYISRIFSSGVASVTGPKISKGKILNRLYRKLTHPAELKERLNTYHEVANDPQKGFCLFQEYIPHDYEWRVVRIGESFFAHKKVRSGEKASGTLIKGYGNPPLQLLEFVKDITDRFGFFSQAVDIFEIAPGNYLVNEMQCIFGQSDPYQMLIDGKPGRYLKDKSAWRFEEGDFASNQCYDLRVQYVIDKLSVQAIRSSERPIRADK